MPESRRLDGSKEAIAERAHQEQVVIKMMRQLGIQVRSFADASGFSDWSDPITGMCTWRVE